MSAALKTALDAMCQGWQSDLRPEWRAVFDGVQLDVEAMDPSLPLIEGKPIIPARKGHPLPGAREDAHVLRAFDALTPDDVRVVLLGQDPYLEVAQATGRSFEQGDLVTWSVDDTARSLRRMVQLLAQHLTGSPHYVAGDEAWARTQSDIASGVLPVPAPRALFDLWEQQGVLCVNAAMTFSRYHRPEQEAHMAAWRPVMRRLLSVLAARPGKPLVVVSFGSVAAQVVKEPAVQAAVQAAAGNVATVRVRHPSANDEEGAPRILKEGVNPFAEVDAALRRFGQAPVQWC